MHIKLEHLNIGTGALLFIAGIFYAVHADYTSALNWSIFGAMYLVMDDYKVMKLAENRLGHHLRHIFCIVGFSLAALLNVYIILL